MDNFTDYYTLLGVDTNASASDIKAAFKKLALQYHPDIYKGADAQERMRLLLLAYQTLNDPRERKTYDAHRTEHMLDADGPGFHHSSGYTAGKYGRSPSTSDVSPHARRDRQRHYDFPALADGFPVQVHVGGISYSLSLEEARMLKEQGMLRGIEDISVRNGEESGRTLVCHRCHHSWMHSADHQSGSKGAFVCPSCKAQDWREYLLLRCKNCSAVFESEQIRDEVGSYAYGNGKLCPPYELFPLCPYCSASGWCPAEDVRVEMLRTQAARRAVLLRSVWIGIAIIAVVAGFLVLQVMR